MRNILFILILFLSSCAENQKLDSAGNLDTKENPNTSISVQKEGFIDKNGWKQGMHKGSSGNSLFDRTYVNDTLNGPFRKYSMGGTTWETGFFKNQERNGMWFEYFENGSIKAVKNYNKGLKHGEFRSFYQNGSLEYKALFNADTLVGISKNYFENGNLKSEGNKKNGIWKTYHDNNQLASVENYRENRLFGEKEKYDSNGSKTLPRFLSQKDSDTCVINETELSVKLLFETNIQNRILFFGESLFNGITICTNKSNLIVKCGTAIIFIKTNGVEIHQANKFYCNNEIETIDYGINRISKELPNAEWEFKYIKEKVIHKTSLGNLTVHVQDAHCSDTGSNPISIRHKSNTLTIQNINNLQFFEFDVDYNGIKELYVISYASCQGYLKIYKISKD